MASYVKFRTQLASIMEVLANAAVAEICQLVEDGFASLRLEVSRSQRENLELKSTLQSQRENLELKSTLRLMEVRSGEPSPSQVEETCTRKGEPAPSETNPALSCMENRHQGPAIHYT